MPYSVHFSPADTSGEKAFEEFYVEGGEYRPGTIQESWCDYG